MIDITLTNLNIKSRRSINIFLSSIFSDQGPYTFMFRFKGASSEFGRHDVSVSRLVPTLGSGSSSEVMM